VIIITEFDAEDPEATMHALADEILKYRRADAAAKAIGWADAGGPFALIAPGPRWRPRCTKSPTSRRLRRRLREKISDPINLSVGARALGIERAFPSAMVATGATFASVTWAGTSGPGLPQLAARTTRCFRAARACRRQDCHAHRC